MKCFFCILNHLLNYLFLCLQGHLKPLSSQELKRYISYYLQGWLPAIYSPQISPTPFPPAAALGQSCDMQVQFGYSAYYMLMNYSVDFSACEYKIRTMETVCHMLTWFLLRKTGQVDKTWVSPIHCFHKLQRNPMHVKSKSAAGSCALLARVVSCNFRKVSQGTII